MRILFALLLLTGLALVNCQNTGKEPSLRIATAANLQFVMPVLTKAFTRKTNIPCEVIIGSSGKLTAQIMEGAPYDVFFSADMKYPITLFEKGRTHAAPQIAAYGKLVLWGLQKNTDLKALLTPSIRHIALANPKVAPYGTAALEVLQNLGMFDQLKDKLVYGESIAQVNQFIHTGVAGLGFTALSVVRSQQTKEKGHWVSIAQKHYSPLSQGIVLLKNDRDLEKESLLFYDFLFSREGKEILQQFGYATTKD